MKTVIHKKGYRNCNLFLFGKRLCGKNELNYTICFTDSCLYPPLPVSPITGKDENASWNKLIYVGTLDPHQKASSFGWRHYLGKLELCARFYDHDTGDDYDHEVLWVGEIQKNKDYQLIQRNITDGHVWMVDGQMVARYDEPMPKTWLSSPWFGGGAGLCCQGNVPNQDIVFMIEL